MSNRETTGCVDWPDDLAVTPGGMWVFAYWLADYRAGKPNEYVSLDNLMQRAAPEDDALISQLDNELAEDPFVRCTGPDATITLAQPDAPMDTDVYPPDRIVPYAGWDATAKDRDRYLRSVYDAGAPVLGALCLGTINQILRRDEQTWVCTINDLNHAGKRLLRLAGSLYNRDAHLVTYTGATN